MVWASTAAGLGVIIATSLTIIGATRAQDLRRDGRLAAAGGYALIGLVGAAVVAAAVVFGIVVMTSK